MEGGTEAFPDLGKHCQQIDCHQLDFLPFKCDACRKVFCVEHRSGKSHECPKPDHNSRKVVVCEICSSSFETTGKDEQGEKTIMNQHQKSGNCDPKKKNKPKCPVKRCKEVLTFSNTSTCRTCDLKVCLKHRFPADHECKRALISTARMDGGRMNNKFMAAFALRNGKDCAKNDDHRNTSTPPASNPSVKAY